MLCIYYESINTVIIVNCKCEKCGNTNKDLPFDEISVGQDVFSIFGKFSFMNYTNELIPDIATDCFEIEPQLQSIEIIQKHSMSIVEDIVITHTLFTDEI